MTFRVLIIDDDEKLNQLLTDYLGKMGFIIACLKAFWGCFLPVSSSCSMWATNCDPLWHAWKLHLNSFRKIHPVKFTHRRAGNGADGNGDFRNCFLKSKHGQLNREKTDLVKLIQGSCLAFKGTCTGDSFWKCSGNVSGFRRRGTNTNRIEKFIGQWAKIFKCGKCAGLN